MIDTQELLKKEIQGMDELDLFDFFVKKAMSSENKNIRCKENKIRGCVSGLWVKAELENGVVSVSADSDSLLIKGIALCICEIFSHMTIEQVRNTEIDFLNHTDLSGELDERRRIGLSKIKDRVLSLEK